MIKELLISVTPAHAANHTLFKQDIANEIGIDETEINHIEITKRAIDARKGKIKINITVKIFINQVPASFDSIQLNPINKSTINKSKKVYIIGAGPAGLFAALQAIENGYQPIIFERGKTVRNRRRDLALINKEQTVNPESNYCFGEGGAGTYSDGKLYTRASKRGDVNKVLHTFVYYGADRSILIDNHPHIGTNKLPQIIENIREAILACEGEIYFNTKLLKITHQADTIKSIITLDNEAGNTKEWPVENLILATGHSARDIYEMLHKEGIKVEAKPYAMGVRVEHPQDLIDSIQYHCLRNNVQDTRAFLPAASYALVTQIEGRGVYSFCMCPGGIIAPCATAPEEVVTNGWSPSKRNNPYANSGIVVSVDENDYDEFKQHGPLAGMMYQQSLEQQAWLHGGKTQVAPGQRLMDFVQSKVSATLPTCSYIPGVKSVDMHEVLNKAIANRLKLSFKEFDNKMKGYLTNEAIIVGVESRTSTPVRIPRNPQTFQHVTIKGLFPCGEGAGYAGGIVSAAMDGINCANALLI